MADELNPRAFPVHAVLNGAQGPEIYEPGMSLRDHFAGRALVGLLAAMKTTGDQTEEELAATMAGVAYKVADALLVARLKPKISERNFVEELYLLLDEWAAAGKGVDLIGVLSKTQNQPPLEPGESVRYEPAGKLYEIRRFK